VKHCLIACFLINASSNFFKICFCRFEVIASHSLDDFFEAQCIVCMLDITYCINACNVCIVQVTWKLLDGC